MMIVKVKNTKHEWLVDGTDVSGLQDALNGTAPTPWGGVFTAQEYRRGGVLGETVRTFFPSEVLKVRYK